MNLSDDISHEAITHLQNLIRINTINPPGNELEAIKYISQILNAESIEHQIFETAPGRANLIARINGNGKKRPLLLNGHLDVVPAQWDQWKHPPFSGIIEEDCIWGRGAIDMKQMVVYSLMMLLALKRKNIILDRDIIFAAVADEEEGCEFGSRWLVENKPELLDAEYALNEGGAFSLNIDGHVFYPIGVAEKGLCWFKVTSTGEPGHGSVPHENMALVKLAKATADIGKNDFPYHKHPLVEQFIRQISKTQTLVKSLILKGLLVSRLERIILGKMFPDKKKARQFHSLLHNTASPTILNSGSKINVIPSVAELHIDGRIIPGETVDSFIHEVKQIMGEGFGIEISQAWNPTLMNYQNPFFDHLKQTLINHDPKGIPIPYLIPGFTDSAHYSRLGIKCYGFAPVKLPPEINFAELFHGHNERIPVEGFKWGLAVMWDVIRNA